MTVGDAIQINVNVGNLNAYTMSAKLSSDVNGALSYSLPASTFTVKPRSVTTKTITLTAASLSPY